MNKASHKKVEYTPSKLYEKKEAIKGTITRYKDIIFGSDTPLYGMSR